MIFPFRSIVIPLAPMIRPWPRQSVRLLLTIVLTVIVIPQKTGRATGAGPTVQTWAAGRRVGVQGQVDRAHLRAGAAAA